MTRKVELIYDSDCPNARTARERLKEALEAAGLPPKWNEWRRGDPESPPYALRYGSPTILVDGKDVAGLAPGGDGSSCRVYTGAGGGFSGVPPLETIVAALRPEPPKTSWRGAFAVLPAVGASLLPVGICPACWPAYAGLLGSLGLGVLLDAAYLLPVMTALLGLALASLAYRARSRRGYGHLWLGLIGAGVAISGKFLLSQPAFLYGGLAIIVAASIWNSWPRRITTTGPCPACAEQTTASTPARE